MYKKKQFNYELPFFYLNFLLTFFSSPFGITSQKSDNFPVRPSALQSSLSMRLNFLIINAVATRATAPAATPITTDFFMINLYLVMNYVPILKIPTIKNDRDLNK